MSNEFPLDNPPRRAALTVYTNSAGPLGKRFDKAADGRIVKRALAELATGSAVRHEVASLAEFAQLRAGLSADQALGYGVCAHQSATLITAPALAKRARKAPLDGVALVARTKDYFQWPVGPGIVMIDHDPLPGSAALHGEELHETLCSALPLLRDVGMLWVPSAGSHVFDAVTGQEVVPLRGSRMYMLIDDASAIPAAGRLLLDRLVLGGHGSIVLAGNGRMMQRTIIDAAVWEATRLDFVRSTCSPGLDWRSQPGRWFGPSGGVLCAADVSLQALEPEQQRQLEDTWAKLRAEHADAAKSRRDEWAHTHAAKALGPEATPEQIELRARALADAAEGGRLDPAHELHLQDGRTVTVADVLAAPHDFDGLRLHDPAEPDYGNDNRIASIWVGLDDSISISSWAHGGVTHEIRGPATAEEDLAGIEEGADDAVVESPGARDAASKSSATLRIWRPAELDELPPPRWLVKGWFPERGVACLVGEPNVGKSFVALDLSVSVSQGWDWLGNHVERGAAVYVAAEGAVGMRSRLKAIAQHHEVPLTQLHAFGLITQGLDLRAPQKDAQRLVRLVRQFAAEEGQPVKLVVLDTLNRMMPGGDENSSVDMGSLIDSAARIVSDTGALVLLIHHTGKDASKGARGHSSLKGNLDTLVIAEKKGSQVEMRLDKQRDGPTDPRLAYRLQSVDLGVVGDELEQLSSAVVLRAGATPAHSVQCFGEWQTIALDVWRDAEDPLGDPVAFDFIYGRAKPLLAARGKTGENNRAMLRRAIHELVDQGVLVEEADGYVSGPHMPATTPQSPAMH